MRSGSPLEAAMSSDVLLEKPIFWSPETTAATIVAPA
jgi:hypothetical protein